MDRHSIRKALMLLACIVTIALSGMSASAARMHRDDCIVRHERISCGLQDDDRKD